MKDPDQLFMDFVKQWAEKDNKWFIIDEPDDHESEDLIDGMQAFDIWGWLIDENQIPGKSPLKKDKASGYGCVIWAIEDGALALRFEQY